MGRKGRENPHFLYVYQMSTNGTFSVEEAPFFCVLGRFLKEKLVCKGRYTRLNGLESPQNLEKQGKKSEKTFKK